MPTTPLHPYHRLDHATVILAAGAFPRHSLALSALRTAQHLVCCDGAVRAIAQRPDLHPSAVVGDFDSLPPSIRHRFPDTVFHHDSDQETNDLTKAFRYCLARGWRSPVILGASGKREDHFLGNISLLADYSAESSGVRMLTDHGLFFVVRNEARFRCDVGSHVSLFSFDPAQRLTASGLLYPLEDLPLATLWRATLNTATAPVVSLRAASPSPILVYLAHPEPQFRA